MNGVREDLLKRKEEKDKINAERKERAEQRRQEAEERE